MDQRGMDSTRLDVQCVRAKYARARAHGLDLFSDAESATMKDENVLWLPIIIIFGSLALLVVEFVFSGTFDVISFFWR